MGSGSSTVRNRPSYWTSRYDNRQSFLIKCLANRVIFKMLCISSFHNLPEPSFYFMFMEVSGWNLKCISNKSCRLLYLTSLNASRDDENAPEKIIKMENLNQRYLWLCGYIFITSIDWNTYSSDFPADYQRLTLQYWLYNQLKISSRRPWRIDRYIFSSGSTYSQLTF